MDLRPELKLSRRENLYQCPGLVIVVFGYFLGSLVTLFLIASVHDTSFEIPIQTWVFSPFAYLCLMLVYAAMTGPDHRKIFSVHALLVAEILYLGVRYVYSAIEYPRGGVLDYPRAAFSSYAAELVAGTGHFLLVSLFFLLLFLPHIRRWARSGVQSDEEAIQVLTDRLKRKYSQAKDVSEVRSSETSLSSFPKPHPQSGRWLRVYVCLFGGCVLYLSVSYLSAIVGRPVPQADALSYEALIQQLNTEEHWQLRVRHVLSQFIGRQVLNYSAVNWAKMPPSTVKGLRLEAVDGLSRHGRDGVEPLQQVLSDADLSICRAAVQGLGVIGKAASDVAPKFRALVYENEDSSDFVIASPRGRLQLDIVRALIAIAPPDAETLDAIETVFDTTRGSGLTALVLELAEPSEPQNGLKHRYLSELLARGSESVAFYIMRALRSAQRINHIPGLDFHPHLQNQQLVGKIESFLRHPEVALRREAALLLGEVSFPSLSLVRTMTDLILDEHPEVQRVAASAIGQWHTGRVPESVVHLRDGLERWLSVEGGVAEEEYWNDNTSLLRPAIDESFSHSKGLIISYASHVSLNEFGTVFLTSRPESIFHRVKEGLTKMQVSNEFERVTTRRILIRALGQQGDRSLIAVPLLRRFADDNTAPERWEAAIALWQVTGQPNEALEVLNRLVESFETIKGKDPLYQILMRAIAACGEMGAPGLGFLSQVLSFQSDRLRLEAYMAIESQMESVAEARAIVERLSEDEYGVIRTRARKAMRRSYDEN